MGVSVVKLHGAPLSYPSLVTAEFTQAGASNQGGQSHWAGVANCICSLSTATQGC